METTVLPTIDLSRMNRQELMDYRSELRAEYQMARDSGGNSVIMRAAISEISQIDKLLRIM